MIFWCGMPSIFTPNATDDGIVSFGFSARREATVKPAVPPSTMTYAIIRQRLSF